jgi:hypothetical protein
MLIEQHINFLDEAASDEADESPMPEPEPELAPEPEIDDDTSPGPWRVRISPPIGEFRRITVRNGR